MKIRTLLVDSSYLLKRSFFGARDTYTDKFGAIGGLYSFITTLRKLIKEMGFNKIVLVWDGENGGIARYALDHNYKANRKDKSWSEKIELTESEIKKEIEKEESILKNKKRIQAYAEELFLRQIEVDEIEGDDIIASYCMKYNNKEEIIIFSNDRDYSQLLDLNISIIFNDFDVPINKTNFFHYFDYVYSNALIIKIICGDVSDNIKGAVGVQEKTLFKYFPDIRFKKMTVRDVCRLADELNKKRISENKKPLKAIKSILDSVNRFKLNHKLINLKEPFLNEEAVESLEQLDMPLSPDDRGSKNLYRMMMEDEFLSIYNGTFVDYVQPFYSVIMNEKQLLTEYKKKNNKTR